VFCHESPSAHCQYWFRIEQVADKEARSLAALPDGPLQTIIDLLQQSLDSLDRGWRQLRSVEILGKCYYVDERLRQLRNVEDPDDFVDL